MSVKKSIQNRSKNNYTPRLPEEQINKIVRELSNPNYEERSHILPKNTDLIEKVKYKLCQNVITYQQKNRFSETKLAKKLGVDKSRIVDILFAKTYKLELSELTCFASEKLRIRDINLGNVTSSQVPRYFESRFLFNNQEKAWKTTS